MNRWRLFIIGFWVFVGGMLLWQAYTYNNQVTVYTEAHPEKHWFYDPGAAAPPPAPKAPAPDIRQIVYHLIPASPAPGSFTVQFTVKNVGNVAATSVQVKVRPYRGIIIADVDNGHAHGAGLVPGEAPTRSPGNDLPGGAGPISDQDPISQMGQWVTLPDLAPGQTGSGTAVFSEEPNTAPNPNPQLEISFEPVKPK